MEFDPTYKPDLSRLPPAARSSFDAVRDHFRAQHLAVQFIRPDGARDEWCFRDFAQRDAFCAGLGAPCAIS